MFRKTAKVVVLSLLFMSFLVIKVNAQEIIIPEKRALIKELLEVTEVTKLTENVINTMLLQMERNYPQLLSGALKNEKDIEQKKERIIESQRRFSKRFRELYPQRVNLEQVMEQLYYPLYGKYFTEDELRDLVIFYKSPTGKKSIMVMPQLMQESMQKSSELLNPKIIQLVNEIMEEEKKRLEEEETAQEKKQ